MLAAALIHRVTLDLVSLHELFALFIDLFTLCALLKLMHNMLMDGLGWLLALVVVIGGLRTFAYHFDPLASLHLLPRRSVLTRLVKLAIARHLIRIQLVNADIDQLLVTRLVTFPV